VQTVLILLVESGLVFLGFQVSNFYILLTCAICKILNVLTVLADSVCPWFQPVLRTSTPLLQYMFHSLEVLGRLKIPIMCNPLIYMVGNVSDYGDSPSRNSAFDDGGL